MMSVEDVARARNHAKSVLLEQWPDATPRERGFTPGHQLWMLEQIAAFMLAGRREKAMRWLGFVQGWLWASGYCTIDEMKEANKPVKESSDEHSG